MAKFYLLKSSTKPQELPQLLSEEQLDVMEPMERADYFESHDKALRGCFGVGSNYSVFKHPYGREYPQIDEYRNAAEPMGNAVSKHLEQWFSQMPKECRNDFYKPSFMPLEFYTQYYHQKTVKDLVFHASRANDKDSDDGNDEQVNPLPLHKWDKMSPQLKTFAICLAKNSPKYFAHHLMSDKGHSSQSTLNALTNIIGLSYHEALTHVMAARDAMRDNKE